MRLQVHPEHPQPHQIRKAVQVFERGGVLAYPTDTVYGIGCDLRQKKAIERIYQIKQLPKTHPLTFLCADLSDIAHYALVDNYAYRIMKHRLPGPYCFVLKATKEVPKLLTMKRKTVGIRVPAHPVTQALLREFGAPFVSSSASIDEEMLSDPADIATRFRGLDMIVDAGEGKQLPSTMIDLSQDQATLIREGAGSIEGLF